MAASAQLEALDLWTAWTVWRGDRAKLLRIAATMRERCEGCPVSVLARVLDDEERYLSFRRFARDVSSQTLTGFESIGLHAHGAHGTIELMVRRDASRDLQTGVVLRVAARTTDDLGWSADTRARVSAAVTRGAINWRWLRRPGWARRLANYEPIVAQDETALQLALAEANRQRLRLIRSWTATIVALVLAAVVTVALPVWRADAIVVAGAFAGCALAGIVSARLSAVRNQVLPAVEVADRTPGRRLATRGAALAAPVVVALIKRL